MLVDQLAELTIALIEDELFLGHLIATYKRPRYGEQVVADATANRGEGHRGVDKQAARLPPADARTVGGPGGGAVPSVVGHAQQVVDGFAGDVSVNKGLRESFGQVRGAGGVIRIPS